MKRCFYQQGTYDQLPSFQALDATLTKLEARAFPTLKHALRPTVDPRCATENLQNGQKADRVFYLSIPPSIFVPVAQNSANAASSKSGTTFIDRVRQRAGASPLPLRRDPHPAAGL